MKVPYSSSAATESAIMQALITMLNLGRDVLEMSSAALLPSASCVYTRSGFDPQSLPAKIRDLECRFCGHCCEQLHQDLF